MQPIKRTKTLCLSSRVYSLITFTTQVKMSNYTILISLLILFSSSTISNACHKHDVKALQSIISSFPPNSLPPSSSSWNTSVDCCTWDAVQCDLITGRISALQINDIPTLRGPIPPSIARLSSLTRLVLSNLPGLTGRIPHRIAKLKQLQILIISNTSVSGPVPAFLSRLPTLQMLDLSINRLSGSIPPSLDQLINLNYLHLGANQLTGPIPASLFSRVVNNQQTVDLDLSGNRLTEEIPKSFGSVNFTTINLAHNKLTGDASCLFGKLSPVSSI